MGLGPELIRNGDFKQGLAEWKTNPRHEPRVTVDGVAFDAKPAAGIDEVEGGARMIWQGVPGPLSGPHRVEVIGSAGAGCYLIVNDPRRELLCRQLTQGMVVELSIDAPACEVHVGRVAEGAPMMLRGVSLRKIA